MPSAYFPFSKGAFIMTEEQKIFIKEFNETLLQPVKAEAVKYETRGYRAPRYKSYRLIETVRFEPIGDGGFRLEFILKRKKIEALYVAGKSTVDMEFALEVLKNAIVDDYFGYASDVLFKAHPIPRLYRGILALQSIVVPEV